MFGKKSHRFALAGFEGSRDQETQFGQQSRGHRGPFGGNGHRHEQGPFSGPPHWLAPMMMKRHFPFGPGRHGNRMFARGDLKFALLELLQERPKHGYEMMKELESRAGGFYTPSAGAIYPTLQMMEDRTWVNSHELEGKKIYTITDAGRQALKDQEPVTPHQEFNGPPPPPWAWGTEGYQPRPELDALGNEFREMARLVWTTVMQSHGNVSRIEQIRAILTRTRIEIQSLAENKNDPDQVSL